MGLRTSSASISSMSNADPIPAAPPARPSLLCAHTEPRPAPGPRWLQLIGSDGSGGGACNVGQWDGAPWRREAERLVGRCPWGAGLQRSVTMATVTRPPRRARGVRCRCPSRPSLPPGGGRACSTREPHKQRSDLTSGAEPAPPARPQRRRPHRARPSLGTEQGGRTRNRCSGTPCPSDSRPLCRLPASAWLPRRQSVRPTAGRKGVCVSAPLSPEGGRCSLRSPVHLLRLKLRHAPAAAAAPAAGLPAFAVAVPLRPQEQRGSVGPHACWIHSLIQVRHHLLSCGCFTTPAQLPQQLSLCVKDAPCFCMGPKGVRRGVGER